jgi:hypothetical protein
MKFDKLESMKIKREISDLVDMLYKDAIDLGDHAAEAFEGLNKNERRRHRSQMTGLENIAETTLKVSDVLDYIKKQTARREYWRAPSSQSKDGFGKRLKEYLENSLAQRAKAICNSVGINQQTDPNGRARRHIHLLLIRPFIRQVVVQYEYRASDYASAIGEDSSGTDY